MNIQFKKPIETGIKTEYSQIEEQYGDEVGFSLVGSEAILTFRRSSARDIAVRMDRDDALAYAKAIVKAIEFED